MTGNSQLQSQYKPTKNYSYGQDLMPNLSPEELSQLEQGNILENLKPLEEIYEELKEDLKERTSSPKYPIGLKTLDETLWGLHKKELLVIGARPNQGKSMLALHMARELTEQQQKVIYFSLEMSNKQLMERLLSNVLLINSTDIRHGKANDDIKEKEPIWNNWLSDAKLLIDDRYGYKFNNITQICDALNPDFIIIDYVQLVSLKGYKDKLSALEEFVKELHTLCIKKDMGAILVSQINRGGAEHLTMDKLKGAGVIEEIADTVILLHWEWDTKKYIIKVDKQRHGECGSIEVIFEPQFSRFRDTEFVEILDEVKRKDLL